MELAKIITYILTAGFGWAIIAYSGYARPKGWLVGSLLASDFSWLQGLAYIAILGSIAASAFTGPWWHALVVLILANLFVRILFPICGYKSQIYGMLGVVVGIPASLAASLLW